MNLAYLGQVVRCSPESLGCGNLMCEHAPTVPILTDFQAAELVLSMEAFAHIFTGATVGGAARAIGSSKGYFSMVSACWARQVLDFAIEIFAQNGWSSERFQVLSIRELGQATNSHLLPTLFHPGCSRISRVLVPACLCHSTHRHTYRFPLIYRIWLCLL